MENPPNRAPRWGWVALYVIAGSSFASRAVGAAIMGEAKIPFAGTISFAAQPWGLLAAIAALALISFAMFFCAYENYRPQASEPSG